MLTKPLQLALGSLVVVAGMLSGQHAYADPVDPVPVYCDVNPVPGCTVRAGTPGSPGQPGGGGDPDPTECRNPAGVVVPCYIEGRGSLGSDGCYYLPYDGGPPPAGRVGPGSWYRQSCDGTDLVGLVWRPDSESPISPAVLARQAVSLLRLPAPEIRTSPANPSAQVIYVPTWLWIESSSWSPRSATASVPGLSVTATATPKRVMWSTGDGATVTCTGPGTPWKAGMNPAAVSPTCGHTYRTASVSSAGGVFGLQATVTWHITWAGGGASGSAGSLTTTDAVSLRVVEAGGLNTNGGGR